MFNELRSTRHSAALSLGVFALGLGLAALGSRWLDQRIGADAEADFRRAVERVSGDVERRFRQPVFGLKGGRGVYAASDHVSRAEFRSYVESYDLPKVFPGVRGLGYIERVTRQGVDAFVARERADGAPTFAIRQLDEPDHDDLFVIKFIEPAAKNAGAMGLDVGSEARRRAGVLAAIDSGQPTMTAAVTLVQDSRRTPGVLMYVPYYAGAVRPATVEARRASLVGLVYAPIVLVELLDGIQDVVARRVDIELFDVTAGGADAARLFPDPGADPAAKEAAAVPRAVLPGRRHAAVQDLPLLGRTYSVRVTATPEFEAAVPYHAPWMVFASGALVSAMLAALLWQQASGRRRAERLARKMTGELDRLAEVVRHTSNAVLMTDRDLRITWINEGFTRISGYGFDEAHGKTPGELLGSGKADPQALRTLSVAASLGQGCRVEILNRAKDGHEYWIDTEVQPMHDARGRLIGFMEIGTDISERRQAQAALEAALRDNAALLQTLDMHAIVSVADRGGRIVDANDAFCRISGYRRDELLGQNHRIVNSGVHPPEFWQTMWTAIAHGTPWRGEVCNRAKDGRLYWVDTFIAPFKDGDGRAEKFISIRTDVTASKAAERELSRQRMTLANIIEGTNVGTWEWNVETGETRINERWAQMIGHSLSELEPTTIDAWRDLIHPEDRPRSQEQLQRHFRGELPGYECETRLRHKDGHWVWMLGRGKVFSRKADGTPRWMAGTHMDISRRKQAEEALRASQAFLDKAGRIGGVGGWALDPATRTVQWTDQSCRIFDLEPPASPGLDETLSYCADEGRAELVRAIEHCLEGGQSFDLELPCITAAGRRIWVHAVGEAEFRGGRVDRIVGAFQDITARRTLESELRRNNEVLNSVLESLPCGLSVFDGDLNLIASNRSFRRLLDLPDALFDVPCTTFESIIRFNAGRGEYGAGDVEEIVRGIVDRARAPAVPHRFERVRPVGTPLEITGAPMPGGGFVTTYFDISDRRAAAAELERSAQLLRGAIGAIDEAFVLYDPDDRLVFCNEKYRQIYALSADLMVPGARFEDLIRHGAQLGQYAAAIGRVEEWVVERMQAHRAGDTTLVQRLDDGRTLRIVERRMPDGHIVGFRIDITELVRAKEAAEEASSAKSRFLANMSHEIRTPMNAILGMLTLLRKTTLTPQQADYAAKTDGAARSLLGLLNDILDFSKVEAGKMVLDPQPFRMDELLRDLSVILSANVGDKPVEVLFDVDPQLPPWLMGDAMRLQQVLINLGGNAIKFTSEGEVVVSVAVTGRSAAGVELRLAVRDTGIGIAADNQQRIFSSFTQAESSTTRRFGGTGLGLSISQHLVGLMGGRLALDSELGRGSSFHFAIVLPLAETPGPEGIEPPRRTSMRALVVDDNPTAREVLQRMGESLGWTIELAEGGEPALALLGQRAAAGQGFDAVFVDWQMPGIDGWETSRRIRAFGLDGGAPVVVMVTAHGQAALEQRSAADRAVLDGYLVKPVTASMLRDAVARSRPARDKSHPVLARAPRLQGLHVLVAEDNPNNQQVARELLEGEGARVQIAADGLQAVEAVMAAASPFDVVLMDLQMPVLDGYAATARIRSELGLNDLPVVAMTANAMDSDRQACLAAGMNDHVGKPFDLDRLVGVLRRLAGRRDDPLPELPDLPVPQTDVPAAARAAAAAAGVEIVAAIDRFSGRQDVYRRMLGRFVDDLDSQAGRLRTQAAQTDVTGVGHALHALRGLAATLGADALAARVAQAEARLGAAGEARDIAGAVGDACAAIEAARPGLAAVLHGFVDADAAAPATQPAFDATALQSALGRLSDLLQNADMGAMDVIDELRRDFGSALGDRMRSLDAAVVMLDFDQARRLCHGLMEAQAR